MRFKCLRRTAKQAADEGEWEGRGRGEKKDYGFDVRLWVSVGSVDEVYNSFFFFRLWDGLRWVGVRWVGVAVWVCRYKCYWILVLGSSQMNTSAFCVL
jgi:hypothetical protein